MGKKRQVVWDFGFGPVSAPVTAAAAAFGLASVGHLPEVGLNPWWALGTAGAAGAFFLADAVARRLSGWSRMHRVASWAGFGGWSFYALGSTPWQVDTVAALGALTLMSALTGMGAHRAEQAIAERGEETRRTAFKVGIAAEWVDRVERICHIKGARVVAVDRQRWTHPDPDNPGKTRVTGYSIEVLLPEGGKEWTDLATAKSRFRSDADLPAGCTIDVEPGITARRAVIHVPTMNALDGEIMLPADWSRRSIEEEPRFAVGVHSDGSLATATLRWLCGILVGQTGSGKSNQLVTVMSQLLRYDDVLVMGIDFNGGGLFKPFLRPWTEGKAGRPAIDWVATDEAEAMTMLNFLVNAVPRRKIEYEDMMWRANDDKLPVSGAVPEIILVIDEFADLPPKVKARVVELSNRSRAASIRVLTCSLRAVSKGGEGLPAELLKQGKQRIGMHVTDQGEINYLFGWGRRMPKPQDVPAAGYGLIGDGALDPRVFKGYRTKPSTAYDAALATAGYRPELDQVTWETDRRAYDGRWERAEEAGWLKGRPARRVSPAVEVDPYAGMSPQEKFEAGREMTRRAREKTQAKAEPKPRDVFAEIVEQDLADVSVPALISVAVEACAGEDLVHMAVVADRFGLSSRKIGELMRMVGVEPRESPWRGGKAYERDVLVAAADRVRRGLQPVPEDVWEASPRGV